MFANCIQPIGQDLAPSAFHDRFTLPFANWVAEVSRRTLAAVRAVDASLRDTAEIERLLQQLSDVQVAD